MRETLSYGASPQTDPALWATTSGGNDARDGQSPLAAGQALEVLTHQMTAALPLVFATDVLLLVALALVVDLAVVVAWVRRLVGYGGNGDGHKTVR